MKKKIIAALSVLSLACGLTACGMEATAKNPEKTEPETPVYDEPVVLDEGTAIDGVKEQIYGEKPLSFREPQSGITVTTWVHLGTNGLYLYSETDDKNVYYASDRAFHENDSIEYYLDPDPEKTLTAAALSSSVKVRSDCLQVRINALGENQTWFGRATGGYPWVRGYYPVKTAAKVNGEMNVQNGAAGYSTETFIPWGAFGLDGKPQEIGVMPAFVNVDNREDTSRTWFTVKGMGHANPSGYARADGEGFKEIGLSAAPQKQLNADAEDSFYTGGTLTLQEVNDKNELASAVERASLKAKLGEDGIYFLAEVKDKVYTHHKDSVWANDGIELLIDGAAAGGGSVFRDGILRVAVDVDGGIETDITKTGVNDYIPFRRAVFANVKVNALAEAESSFNYRYEYIYEVMIPYASLNLTEKPAALTFGWAVKTPNEKACILDRLGGNGNMEAQDWLWEDGHFPQNPNEYFETAETGIPEKVNYDFPEWTDWKDCAVQAAAKERYNFRGRAAANGLYLNVEQYVNNYVRGSSWEASTHIELEIWQHNIGWGFGGTYFAFFGNGSYYINNDQNVRQIVNQVTVTDRGSGEKFRYLISYEIFVEFDNNLENSQDGPYAFVQIMSYTPEESEEGYENAVKITKDGTRVLWTDNCKSYSFHESGIDGKDTGDYSHNTDAYSDWEAKSGKIRVSEGALVTDAPNTVAIKKDTAFTQGTYTAKAVSVSDGRLGLVFNYEDGNNYNFFYVDRAKWEVGLVKIVNGQAVATTNYLSASFEKMTSYPLKVELNDGKYYCTFWNTLYFIGEAGSGTGIGFASDVAGNKLSAISVTQTVADRRVDTLIIGHSYMEMWYNYASDLNGIDGIGSVYNMGISGSHTSHWNALVDSVAAYEPKTVIVGIGVNDLFWLKDGVRIASENLAKFLSDARAKLPETKFLVFAVNHCVETENVKLHKAIVDLNTNFKTICADDENFVYLDIENAFLMLGKPVGSFFIDGLHPTEQAYRSHFVPAIKAALEGSMLADATPPAWGAEGTVRSAAQERYDYRAYAADDGLYINVVQYVNTAKTEDGDNWKNTHIEMQIWNECFGAGKQYGRNVDTFVACFLDGSYYINNETAVTGIEYRVSSKEREAGATYRYEISYEIYIGFANRSSSTGDPYASVKFMSFAPKETAGYGENAELINMDGRQVWTDKCHSYNVGKKGITQRSGLDVIVWTAWEDCVVRSAAQERYDYRAFARRDGLYLNMVQYVNTVKTDGDNWQNTHIEMQVWNQNFGAGKEFGLHVDTFVACFLDGTYYINNMTNVFLVEYRVNVSDTAAGSAYAKMISYELFIGFQNSFANTDEAYASVKFMSFAPNETTGYGENAESVVQDGRTVWKDKCHSYGINEDGIFVRQSGLLEAIPWTDWEDCEFRSEAPNRFDYRGFATDDGLYLNMVQYVDAVKRDGDNWADTHFEMLIFNGDFGYGMGGTFVACFLDGTYYINNDANVRGIAYSYTVTDLGEGAAHRYKVSYFLHIGFNNNVQSTDGPYAFVNFMSFMPNETGDFGTAQQVVQDGRTVWKDHCNSYGIHENGIDFKDTGV